MMMTMMMTAVVPNAHCLRCERPFRIGDETRCERAPDRGPCEVLHHVFRLGRRDGRCAEPSDLVAGASCGFARDDDRLHFPAV